jgi:hypothetical protein
MTSRSLCANAALTGAAALSVVNPVVVGLIFGWSRPRTAYLLSIDAAAFTVVVLCILHARTGRRGHFLLAATGALALPLVALLAELGVTWVTLLLRDRLNGIEMHRLFRADPLLGWSLVAGATARHRFPGNYDVTYRIDANGRKEIPQNASIGRTLHFFGDSFTFGYGVTNEDTALNLLATRIADRFNVLNHSVPGYGLEQMFFRLRASREAIAPADAPLGGHRAGPRQSRLGLLDDSRPTARPLRVRFGRARPGRSLVAPRRRPVADGRPARGMRGRRQAAAQLPESAARDPLPAPPPGRGARRGHRGGRRDFRRGGPCCARARRGVPPGVRRRRDGVRR